MEQFLASGIMADNLCDINIYESVVNLSYMAFMALELGSFSNAEDVEQTEVEAFRV